MIPVCQLLRKTQARSFIYSTGLGMATPCVNLGYVGPFPPATAVQRGYGDDRRPTRHDHVCRPHTGVCGIVSGECGGAPRGSAWLRCAGGDQCWRSGQSGGADNCCAVREAA
jgi:hypothetical protein